MNVTTDEVFRFLDDKKGASTSALREMMILRFNLSAIDAQEYLYAYALR